MTGVQFLAGEVTECFSLYYHIWTNSEAQPATNPVDTRSSSLRHEANHSSLSSAEAKNMWSYTFTPP